MVTTEDLTIDVGTLTSWLTSKKPIIIVIPIRVPGKMIRN